MRKEVNINYDRNNEYNQIPVYYCRDCLSVLIIDGEEFVDSYCDTCGSTNIGKASLEDFDVLYSEKYGRNFFYTK